MAQYLIDGKTLTGIADAIREKTGSTDSMMASELAAAIEEIESGGGELPEYSLSKELPDAITYPNTAKVGEYVTVVGGSMKPSTCFVKGATSQTTVDYSPKKVGTKYQFTFVMPNENAIIFYSAAPA